MAERTLPRTVRAASVLDTLPTGTRVQVMRLRWTRAADGSWRRRRYPAEEAVRQLEGRPASTHEILTSAEFAAHMAHVRSPGRVH